MKYEKKYKFNHQQFKTVRSFGATIFNDKITISLANKKQSNLSRSIFNLNSKARPRAKTEKKQKCDTIESINDLYRGRKITLNSYKGSDIFPLKPTQGKEFKILNLELSGMNIAQSNNAGTKPIFTLLN